MVAVQSKGMQVVFAHRHTCCRHPSFTSGSFSRPHSAQSMNKLASRSCSNLKALGGGNDDDKKFITREEEPEQFWQTKTERKGQNPAMDPLALIGILGLLIPFIILGIAIGTGVVDVNAGRP